MVQEILGDVANSVQAPAESLASSPSKSPKVHTAPPSTTSAENDDEQQDASETVDVDLSLKKRKSRKKRPASKRGLPTGLEEYNADAPLTVEEVQQDDELYSSEYPFPMRLEAAIHRYETRRRMQSEQKDIFHKYLVFGGVTVQQRMFQGLSVTDRKNLDKDDLIASLAQASLSDDIFKLGSDDCPFTVDFLGVMKAFISRRIVTLYDLSTFESVKKITSLLSNFMSYLLLHRVCPEYDQDILATRTFLDKVAPFELSNVTQLLKWLPGDFNIACSTLFQGYYGRNYDGETDWSDPLDKNPPASVFVGMKDDMARNVMKFGIAAAASEEQTRTFVEYANANKLEVVGSERGGFEITKVLPVTLEIKQFYKTQSPGFRPVGRVLAKKWHIPGLAEEDLTKDEREALETTAQNGGDKNQESDNSADYEFFFEAQILQYYSPGVKLDAEIRKLNCGIMFIDEIFNTFPSFDSFISNDLMLDYVKPRTVGVLAEEEAAERAEREWEREAALAEEAAAEKERERELRQENGPEVDIDGKNAEEGDELVRGQGIEIER